MSSHDRRDEGSPLRLLKIKALIPFVRDLFSDYAKVPLLDNIILMIRTSACEFDVIAGGK